MLIAYSTLSYTYLALLLHLCMDSLAFLYRREQTYFSKSFLGKVILYLDETDRYVTLGAVSGSLLIDDR